jgi:hypothetical protein
MLVPPHGLSGGRVWYSLSEIVTLSRSGGLSSSAAPVVNERQGPSSK